MCGQHVVQDWMTSPAITVSPSTKVGEALDIMMDQDIRRLPVVNEEGALVGIISLSDLREYFYPSREALLYVKDIMMEEVVTVQERELMRDVAIYMLDHKIGGVPVVDSRRHVVGIVTESDMLRLIIEAEES